MANPTSVFKRGLRGFLQQLQANPVDIRDWTPSMRFSLLRGGFIDLTIYGQRVASAPRYAFMAVSSRVLAHFAKHPAVSSINFTFDVPALHVQQKQDQESLAFGKRRMTDRQIKCHEGALKAIASWLTALCTPTPIALLGASFVVDLCIRFMCTHTLVMQMYAQHLTAKFITQASRLALDAKQLREVVKSCHGDNDDLLLGLAAMIVEKKLDKKVALVRLESFLRLGGFEVLRKKVGVLERQMGIGAGRVKEEEVIDGGIMLEVKERELDVHGFVHNARGAASGIELDPDGWQIFPTI